MASFELMPGGLLPGGGYRPSITVIHDVELQPQRAKVRHLPLMPHEEPESPELYTTGFAEVAEAHPHGVEPAEMQREHAEMHRKVADLVKASSQLNQAMRLGRMTAPAYLRTKSKLNEQAQALLDQKRRLDQAARYKGPRGAQGATPLAEAELRSRMMAQGSLAFPEFERSWERKDKELAEARKAQAAAQRAGLRKKVAPLPLSGIKDPELRRLYSEQMIEEEEGSPFMGGSEMFVSEEINEPLDTDWMFHEGHDEFAKENPDQSGILFEYFGRYSSLEPIYAERKLFAVRDTSGRLDLAASAKQALQHLRETRREPPSIMTLYEDGRRVRDLRESDLMELSGGAKTQRNPGARVSRKNPDAPFEGIVVEWHEFTMTSSWPLTTTQYRAFDRPAGGMAVAARQALAGIEEAVKQGSAGSNYSYMIMLVEQGSKPLNISLGTLKQLAKR